MAAREQSSDSDSDSDSESNEDDDAPPFFGPLHVHCSQDPLSTCTRRNWNSFDREPTNRCCSFCYASAASELSSFLCFSHADAILSQYISLPHSIEPIGTNECLAVALYAPYIVPERDLERSVGDFETCIWW